MPLPTSFLFPKLGQPVLDQQHRRLGTCELFFTFMNGLRDEESLSIRRDIERSAQATPPLRKENGVRHIEKFNRLAKSPNPRICHGNGHHAPSVPSDIEDCQAIPP